MTDEEIKKEIEELRSIMVSNCITYEEIEKEIKKEIEELKLKIETLDYKISDTQKDYERLLLKLEDIDKKFHEIVDGVNLLAKILDDK